MVGGFSKGAATIKRTAVDLAKSVYQVSDSVRVGQVSQHYRLRREHLGDIYSSRWNQSSG